MYVAEVDALEHLPQNSPDGVLVESAAGGTLVQIVEHRAVDELEHQVQVLLATEHLDQVHEVLVAQLLIH